MFLEPRAGERSRKSVAGPDPGPAGCYNDVCMGSKLSTANPYLRDPVLRERSVLRSVASSSAIEGIRAPFRKMARASGKSGTVSGVRTKSNGKTRLTRA